MVKAAGNNGNDYQASMDNGVPLTTTFGAGSEYDMTNLFITVVAASPENTLPSYSQTCGAGQAYCLTAPGGDAAYYTDEAIEKCRKNGITVSLCRQMKLMIGQCNICMKKAVFIQPCNRTVIM